ncbi:beta-lactamase-like protein [Ochromonadaceae sp. CCMP2298]|nr:beta-lactamase-like protein [Ochromonadaceae sp. CCMP2298]
MTAHISAATGGLLTRLRSVPVLHCHSSYGLVLDFAACKVVYSGDCRPSQSLARAGLDCDLLIHEATFTDARQADALKKRHSTTSEARRVAAQMRARHVVLTHFSQRYPLEVAEGDGQGGMGQEEGQGHSRGGAGDRGERGDRAALSFDFLRFSFPSQAHALPRATRAIGLILTALEAARQKELTLATAEPAEQRQK